uniref:Coiled-coil domain-containing protein 135 n=1 Tax=Trichobilharzia regenti TaxID=157069 RepID=A0AA85K453_TRIRE|nr:unnamed protein product [Trichobilharzia regenti]
MTTPPETDSTSTLKITDPTDNLIEDINLPNNNEVAENEKVDNKLMDPNQQFPDNLFNEQQTISSTEEVSLNEINDPAIRQQFRELDPLYLPDAYEKLPETFETFTFPNSYKENTLKESRLLEYCENFSRQYEHLCPDRTKLLLIPKNECGIRKFVCTTLTVTRLPYPELYTWEGTAKFVADFLNFVPLIPSTELPKRLLSPMTTIQLQKGTCFEYAMLLCSLLLAVGYDAYVVSGYATRECCYMDETRETCPYLIEEEVEEVEEEEPEPKRYIIKPAKDLTSKYEQAMAAKDLQTEIERNKQAKKDAELSEAELYKPSEDPLYGLRIHAWILILPGKRDVSEGFFIEALTGQAKPLDCSMYLGIESLWNHQNYWVNMQDCSNGITHLKYNLSDGICWEYLLPSGSLNIKFDTIQPLGIPHLQSNEMPQSYHIENVQSTLNFNAIQRESQTRISNEPLLILPNSIHKLKSTKHTNTSINSSENNNSNDGEYLNDNILQKLHKNFQMKPLACLEDKLLLYDLPPTWTLPIVIDQELFELRYPKGFKKKQYKYSLVENFAPFSQYDGLILRLTIYQDRELTNPIEIRETYANRADKLISRTIQIKTNWIVEKFDHGRNSSHLAEHGYYRSQQSLHTTRYMLFYNEARVDCLEKREQTPTTMIEHYKNREDRLFYREVIYSAKMKRFGPAPPPPQPQNKENTHSLTLTTVNQLNIDKILERFTRNPEVDADEDVSEIIFNIIEDRIFLTYHIGKERIIPSTREFIKPPPSDDRRDTVQLYCDTHTTFQVDLFAKPKTQVEIYNMLVNLLAEEEKSKELVRKSENEISKILNERLTEELQITLTIDLFDTLRNLEAQELRIELERIAENERNRCKEIELDYLEPFLAQIEIADNKLTREQAFALREECLLDCKQRLITKANIIQARFEKETESLQKKQQWYHLNQINLSKEDEQEYLQYCKDATFKITTLESMLAWHKRTAPQRYMALEKRLRSDPRLREFLQTN